MVLHPSADGVYEDDTIICLFPSSTLFVCFHHQCTKVKQLRISNNDISPMGHLLAGAPTFEALHKIYQLHIKAGKLQYFIFHISTDPGGGGALLFNLRICDSVGFSEAGQELWTPGWNKSWQCRLFRKIKYRTLCQLHMLLGQKWTIIKDEINWFKLPNFLLEYFPKWDGKGRVG